MSTEAARSPGTGRVRSPDTRSSRLPAPIDVVAYVRLLEEMMIRVCADFGVSAGRVDGQSGTWILADPADPRRRPNRKIGAIGIRVSRQVAMHGFAFNANPSLAWADVIIPCGIPDAGGHVAVSRSGP
jgi:lipoyl(octanoyl) transferase